LDRLSTRGFQILGLIECLEVARRGCAVATATRNKLALLGGCADATATARKGGTAAFRLTLIVLEDE
jgi:predicted metal-binding protein